MVSQGDIIWLDFDPQTGHEQKGRRPAIVISNESFNRLTKKAAFVCPITRTDRTLPLHVQLDERTQTTGVIMCDQAKAIDIQARNYEFIEQAPVDIVHEVIDIVSGFVEIEPQTRIPNS